MSDNDYVWYASYGSNLNKERFLCYIRSGYPDGSNIHCPGCRDSSDPINETPFILRHELYFAKTSVRWQNGGIAFVKVQQEDSSNTYAYMYLITKEQFCDVVKQETRRRTEITLDFENAITNGNLIFNQGGTYGNLIYVGDNSGSPIFTFTNSENIQTATRPSTEYLRMIIDGLIDTHKLQSRTITDYLMSKRGIIGNYAEDEIQELIMQVAHKKKELS